MALGLAMDDDEEAVMASDEVLVMVVGGETRRSSRLRFLASLAEERRLIVRFGPCLVL